jgi:hypothetical protein
VHERRSLRSAPVPECLPPEDSTASSAALRDFVPAQVGYGSFSTEGTVPGKQVDVGYSSDSSGTFHGRLFVGLCNKRL